MTRSLFNPPWVSDLGASSGVRAILCHPKKKKCLGIVYVSCVCIFGYPFGSNKGSNSHNSTISVGFLSTSELVKMPLKGDWEIEP